MFVALCSVMVRGDTVKMKKSVSIGRTLWGHAWSGRRAGTHEDMELRMTGRVGRLGTAAGDGERFRGERRPTKRACRGVCLLETYPGWAICPYWELPLCPLRGRMAPVIPLSGEWMGGGSETLGPLGGRVYPQAGFCSPL